MRDSSPAIKIWGICLSFLLAPRDYRGATHASVRFVTNVCFLMDAKHPDTGNIYWTHLFYIFSMFSWKCWHDFKSWLSAILNIYGSRRERFLSTYSTNQQQYFDLRVLQDITQVPLREGATRGPGITVMHRGVNTRGSRPPPRPCT